MQFIDLTGTGSHKVECVGYISHTGTWYYNIHSTTVLVRFSPTLQSDQWTKKI